uniref:Uncharacterized protein n=1 Tax=viral metagenome TaxID=1070528 RepID=A0A6M3JEI8_9ZZZZ
MSSDNGIYCLQSKDGFRVAHLQAIDNLYWWRIYQCDCEINEDNEDWDTCSKCGAHIVNEQREKINPITLKNYFGDSKVFKTKEEVLLEANKIYEEILEGCCPIVEYGIQFIGGWEEKEFPK